MVLSIATVCKHLPEAKPPFSYGFSFDIPMFLWVVLICLPLNPIKSSCYPLQLAMFKGYFDITRRYFCCLTPPFCRTSVVDQAAAYAGHVQWQGIVTHSGVRIMGNDQEWQGLCVFFSGDFNNGILQDFIGIHDDFMEFYWTLIEFDSMSWWFNGFHRRSHWF